MDKTISRLKRVNGQISGLMRMIEDGEKPEKIITQFQAAKGAFESAFAENLKENLSASLKKKNSKNLKKILNLIAKR